jgi:RNA polymerase sigma-70 factor (ECF subfamily)
MHQEKSTIPSERRPSTEVKDCDAHGSKTLFEEAYEDLRNLAAHHFQRESEDNTLQPTVVVHEVFLRMTDQRKALWESRAQFLCVASRMMQRVLVDHARSKRSAKRGGSQRRVPFDEACIFSADRPEDFLAVCEALDTLKTLSERQGQIVELRFFGGLTLDEIVEVTGLSGSTIERSWRAARAWLRRELSDLGNGS